MKLIFCGGAMEVGASCYLLKVSGKNILLDCGVRMGSNKDNFPDFSLIQENGGIDAIFVSHAHLDHTGALPVISRVYPAARIYMTQPTKDLVRVLLYDSLRIMEREVEIPKYTENHVVDMLDRVLCYSPYMVIKPFDDCDITATFYSAGHILGAASIYIKTPEGSVFYSGDFSGFKQNTIEGAGIPRLRPDVAIVESTYGDKLHANREMEENRLVEMINKVLDIKGNVLIPAFALGRAQEIILILRRAMAKKNLPMCEIFVDGMVKDICRVYQQNPNYLRAQLAKKIFKGNDIFFNDVIQKVDNPKMRDDIIKKDGSSVIISSSGMLTGGPSQMYAEHLAGNEKNYIAITGYQDEESPGRQLLNLADNSMETRVLKINDTNINVNCAVGKYGLSAHADMMEILGLIGKIKPKKVFLVHGAPEVIKHLGEEISKDIKTDVFVPSNGDEIEVTVLKPRKQLKEVRYPTMNKNVPLSDDNIKELWQFIYGKIGTGVALTPQEIASIWGCDNCAKDICELLDDSIYFERNKKRMFLFHALDLKEIENRQKPKIMEMNKMLELADKYFSSDMGVYRKGARQDKGTLLLYFNFPSVAIKRYGDLIEKFKEESKWDVEINTNINTSVIDREVLKALPPGVVPTGKISYNTMLNTVEISLKNDIEGKDEIKDRFKENTGMELIINVPGKNENFMDYKDISQNDNMMEQNLALNKIDEAFRGKKHSPYKKSIKSQNGQKYIELAFVSMAIGMEYNDLIDKLEKETGWVIKVSPSCNQMEIINTATSLCEQRGISFKKNPSIYPNVMKVKIYTNTLIDDSILKDLSIKLKELTGFELIL